MGDRFKVREKKEIFLTRQVFVICNNVEKSFLGNVKGIIEKFRYDHYKPWITYKLYDIKTDNPICDLNESKYYIEKDFIEFNSNMDTIILFSDKNIYEGNSRGFYRADNELKLEEILNKITT